ncbi:hypothetical protein [Actinomadura rubrisoli]|uniref:Uncharacterized protein n=1 Tax=Actinomadura rubrisoli TaxID=2530368 RepID=A0A4R5CH32_9ACTN|nr:hypothetical protein [Actinomadura rubrisoli]TDD97603.1 hypothetical protein E1298_00810 [Actinomadura rubrisoli]
MKPAASPEPAPRFATIHVRRFGEHERIPIVLNDRGACGLPSDHRRRGCIGLNIQGGGSHQLVHLTADEALRLSDLLRAMAEADTAHDEEPDHA